MDYNTNRIEEPKYGIFRRLGSAAMDAGRAFLDPDLTRRYFMEMDQIEGLEAANKTGRLEVRLGTPNPEPDKVEPRFRLNFPENN